MPAREASLPSSRINSAISPHAEYVQLVGTAGNAEHGCARGGNSALHWPPATPARIASLPCSRVDVVVGAHGKNVQLVRRGVFRAVWQLRTRPLLRFHDLSVPWSVPTQKISSLSALRETPKQMCPGQQLHPPLPTSHPIYYPQEQ